MWLFQLLYGVLLAFIFQHRSITVSVVFALAIGCGLPWLGAIVSSAMVNELAPVRSLLKGFGGFGMILPVVLPHMLLTPISCLITRSVAGLFAKRELLAGWQFHLLGMFMWIFLFSLWAMQVREFVRHRAF